MASERLIDSPLKKKSKSSRQKVVTVAMLVLGLYRLACRCVDWCPRHWEHYGAPAHWAIRSLCLRLWQQRRRQPSKLLLCSWVFIHHLSAISVLTHDIASILYWVTKMLENNFRVTDVLQSKYAVSVWYVLCICTCSSLHVSEVK